MVAVTITANVLVTDVVESTTVLTRDGAAAAEAQRLRHDEVVGNVVEVFGGEVLKSTGDGAVALLPSAGLLVRAGAAIAEAARSAEIELRIGAATGDVVRAGGDCFGEAVVVASRLCAEAANGQLLIAPSTVAIRGRRDDPPLQQLPARMLKGFDDPVAPSTLDEPEDTVEAPARDDIRLVGRADVLAAVRAAWAARPGRIVVLRGEPGIGKTFVARALTADVDGDVIWVRFDPTASDGFPRWCSALDETTRRREIGPIAALGRECLSRAATHLPALTERLPIVVTSPDDDDRSAFFDALNDVVRSLRPPAVLVLDDLQWAGGTPLALLQRLAATGAAPVRVLATCRAPLPDGLREIDATVIDVGPLATPELERLVREEGFDEVVAADAAGRAGGNPFLALSGADAGSEPVAADAIAARFLRLDERVVAVLGIAALAGRRIDLPLIERASSTGAIGVGEAIDAAVDAGLLRADERGGLVFVHDLVREAAAGSVPAHRRLGLHAVVAGILAERGDVIGAAPHVLDGFAVLEPPRAVEQVFAACVRLSEVGATEDALDVAQRLLGALEHDPRARPAQFARAHLAIGSVSGALGDIAADKHHAALAGAAAMQAGDRTTLAEAALARASYALAGQADPHTLELLDAALEQVPADDLAVLARLTAMRAFYLFNQEGDGSAARSSVAKAIDMARAANDPVALAEVLTNSSAVGLARSEVREQRAILDELLALAPSLPYREAISARAIAHRQGVVLSLQLGDRAAFDRHRAAAAAIPDRPDSGLLRELGRMWDGLVCFLDGDPKGAIAIGGSLLRRQQRDHNLLASGAAQVFAGHRWRGTLDGVIDGVVRYADEGSGLPLTRSLGAVAVALVGDAARAGALLEPLLAAPDPLVDDSMLGAQCGALIEACTLTDRPYPQVLEPTVQDFSGQLVVTAWGVEVVGAADRFLAILDARRGDVARAAARFDAAAELERRLSPVVALRTQAWRHALLRDVPAPEVPADLGGIEIEVEALRRLAG